MASQVRRMVDSEGNKYDIPFDQIEQAINDGLQLTRTMVDQQGTQYEIPENDVGDAESEGFRSVEVKQPRSPYEERIAAERTIAQSPRRLATALMGGMEGLQQFREANRLEGQLAMRRAEELMKQNPRLTRGQAYIQAGGEIAAPTGPVAITGPAAVARIAPILTKTGQYIARASTKAGKSGVEAVKTAAKGSVFGGGALGGIAGGGALIEKLTGWRPF